LHPTLAQVQAVTDPYAACMLECDGLTNVLHFYLTQAGIRHRVLEGRVELTQGQDAITWHRWISVGTQEGPGLVDYRARMWLGRHEYVPHGAFLEGAYPGVTYQGEEIEPLPLSEGIILALIAQPIPPQWKELYQL
jgi:hypothetical protein